MDLTLPQDLTDIDAAIAQLCASASKDALAGYARASCAWRGDDARTSKTDIARAILEWHASHRAQSEALDDALHAPVEPKPTPKPAAPKAERELFKAPDVANVQTQIAQAIGAALAGLKFGVDEESVRSIVRAELAHIEPARIVVNAQSGEERRIDEHTHPVFDKCVRLATQGVNLLLKGPAGCGKSHLAAQIARALGKDFGALHCSAGASESQLLGWLLPTGEGGRFEYVAAQFARMFANGKALFLIDEMDAADPNFLMVLNGALANGHLHVPQNWKQPSVDRGAEFIVMAAANTYGNGADAVYVGRNQLDAATLDRFYVIEMEYDRKLEAKLAPAEVCAWAWKVRERTAEAKLRRVVSTRTIQKVAAALTAGFDMKEAKRDALIGWTRDELAKVGEA